MHPSYLPQNPGPVLVTRLGGRVAECRSFGLGWSLSASDRVARSSCARRALPTFPWCVWRAFSCVGEGDSDRRRRRSHRRGRDQEVMRKPTT